MNSCASDFVDAFTSAAHTNTAVERPSGTAAQNQDMFDKCPTLSFAATAGLIQPNIAQFVHNTEYMCSPLAIRAYPLTMPRGFSSLLIPRVFVI